MKPISVVFLALTCFALVSCGGSSSGGGGSSGSTTALYVVDSGNGVVDAYSSPTTASGSVTPSRAISGANTQLSAMNILGAAYDPTTDSLFVANTDSANPEIVIFDNVSTVSGNATPSRVLVGSSTGFVGPQMVAVDATRDLLYVVDVSQAVLVFSGAKTIDGNVAPTHTISGSNTTFTAPEGIALDPTNDRLYIMDSGIAAVSPPIAPQIDVFDNASTVTGNTAPNRIITSSANFQFPWGISLDATRDLLYVADQKAARIFVFANASTASGDVAPTDAIGGPTNSGISGPSDVYIDSAADTLYDADANGNHVSVWDNASTVNGDVAPSRSIYSSYSYPTAVVLAN